MAPSTVAAPLSVPAEALVGLGQQFADLYARYLEVPRSFLYFGFLTYFGALTAKMITLESELSPEPRLYTVVIGDSADTRKSTGLRKTDEFFRSLGTPWSVPVLFGVGSAEGMAPNSASVRTCSSTTMSSGRSSTRRGTSTAWRCRW
jgi:hypothetical protein